MNRFRQPTEEERALFEETFKDAKPLSKRRRRGLAAKHSVKSLPPKAVAAAGPAPRPPTHPKREAPAIGGHRETYLRRGHLEPEARLDLHGLTQDEAHRALLRFFARSRALDQRLVLVITGKGGILRAMVPRWLAESEFKPLVSGIRSAHLRHGGGGAFYVALRREKPRAAKLR